MAIDVQELLKIFPELIKSDPAIKQALFKAFDSLFQRSDVKELPSKDPPRLGRRESEPHSLNVSYIHDVLSVNFPQDRTYNRFQWLQKIIQSIQRKQRPQR